MGRGTLIWADLSCLDAASARTFYSAVLGWQFQGGMAMSEGVPIADTFDMPQKFRDIGMPPFWMSYVAVPDVAATAQTAKAMGGKVELGPQDAGDGTLYALIRDPLGAGFSVYQNSGATPARTGHALFVSSASAVMPFYTALFGWRFGDSTSGQHPIRAEDGDDVIATLHELPDNAQRGGFEYWGVLLSCDDLQAAELRIADAGGTVEDRIALPEGPALLARDPDGASFLLVANSRAEGDSA